MINYLQLYAYFIWNILESDISIFIIYRIRNLPNVFTLLGTVLLRKKLLKI